jgi:hypothetical protein
LDRLHPLVVGEFRLAAKPHTSRLGALAAFAGAGTDQLALELGEPYQNR